jgi:putative integral membrane protein (TIGR02587 family)
MQIGLTQAWEKELDKLLRALSGAFLFGVPMLFTLEMWQIGSYLSHGRLLLLLGVALAVNFPLSYFAGFKGESTLRVGIDQAVGALAVGAVASAVMLVILNRIQPGDSLDSILGMIILQAVPFSLGASVANALLIESENDREKKTKAFRKPRWALLNDLGATAAGGMFIGFSIAPTEEVLLIALEMDYWHELALIVFSLVVTYIIVFESGFSPQSKENNRSSFLQKPATETMVAYVLSLFVAAISLYLLGQVELSDPLNSILSQILVLGFPTAIGGAAGRLVI